MKVNIGKNTLGDSGKMSVSLREYGRSTHNLSSAWRSPMGVGTLVPFMKLVGLPGDTFDIDLDTRIMTHPTIGPLFGNFKFQADVFTCPIRLYNAMLHNNTLNIGLDMSKVKLPTAGMWTKNYKMGKGSLAEYLGVRKGPHDADSKLYKGDYQIVPFLAYYDVFKNYYANKQEEWFYIMGGSSIQNASAIVSGDFTGTVSNNEFTNPSHYLICTSPATVTITGTDLKLEDIKKIKFTLDSQPIYIDIIAIETSWEKVSIEKNKIVIKSREGVYYRTSRKIEANNGTSITLKGTTENIAQGTVTDSYTSSFPLSEIDDLREYILSKGREQIRIGEGSDEKLKSLFIYNVLFSPNPETAGTTQNIPPIVTSEMGGLCLKTHQSDLFNNWVNKEWVDGDNGINAVTDVDVSGGKLNLDALNLAQKVYNMLNRIAISGGSYKDWIETVYTTDYYFRAETPVYEGGMSTTIDFEAVVSNSASTASGVEEPLGSMAGRGFNQGKKGGRIKIKCNEPCYIIGIASITPNVDYSQGNDWDMMQLKTMDDLHKPQLDGVGYQDLLSNQMHGEALLKEAIGKQPAWLNYMTDVNKTYADFAAGEAESYMVLNRVYNVNEAGAITNPSTYISPKDYTYIFATNTETNRDFWVQIGKRIIARRVMSAAQIPLM
nr:MAG TPA: Major capsid protein [Microviridae sp.]